MHTLLPGSKKRKSELLGNVLVVTSVCSKSSALAGEGISLWLFDYMKCLSMPFNARQCPSGMISFPRHLGEEGMKRDAWLRRHIDYRWQSMLERRSVQTGRWMAATGAAWLLSALSPCILCADFARLMQEVASASRFSATSTTRQMDLDRRHILAL